MPAQAVKEKLPVAQRCYSAGIMLSTYVAVDDAQRRGFQYFLSHFVVHQECDSMRNELITVRASMQAEEVQVGHLRRKLAAVTEVSFVKVLRCEFFRRSRSVPHFAMHKATYALP